MTDETLPWETEEWIKEHPGPEEVKMPLFEDNRVKKTIPWIQAKLKEWAKEDKEKTKELTNLFT